MTAIVEKVARAIFEVRYPGQEFGGAEGYRAIQEARAALLALRELIDEALKHEAP